MTDSEDDIYGAKSGNDFKFQLTEESKNLLKHRIEENMFSNKISSDNLPIEEKGSLSLGKSADEEITESPLVPLTTNEADINYFYGMLSACITYM